MFGHEQDTWKWRDIVAFALSVRLWAEKTPLLWKNPPPPGVSLMWSAEVDQYVAEGSCVQKLSGPVIPSLNGCDACGGVEQNHHQSWPESENHRGVDTGTEVRRSETRIQSFSMRRALTCSVRVKRLLWPKAAQTLQAAGGGARRRRWNRGAGFKPARCSTVPEKDTRTHFTCNKDKGRVIYPFVN